MTVVILALVIAALIGGVIGFSVRRLGSAGGPAIAEKDTYLQAARFALIDGRRIVQDLETISDRGRLGQFDTEALKSMMGRIDVFGSQMTQVTCLAPTSMDARVSRSVAVSATAVGDTLRTEREMRLDPDRAPRRSAQGFSQRCSELGLAVRDLGNHVELL